MRYDAFLSYSHAADGKLAPALQRALHRFARPWNRMRALRVFRDTTSLAATPELWPTIVSALGESSHFLLLASPQAAASTWVQRELEWWLANRPAEKIFLLLTAGTIVWDEDNRDFDWKLTTALSHLVSGKFQNEPLYVDLTWANQQHQLALRNTRFRQAILDIAAPLHGKDKDQIDGEDVRQFRKARRLRAAAVAGLVALTVASSAAAVVAVKQRNIAIAQSRVALSRQLAADALAGDTRLDVAFLLAAAANHLSDTPQSRAALQRLLNRTPTVKGVLAGDRPEQALAFSASGRLLASAPGMLQFDDPVVFIWSTDPLQLVGRLRPAQTHLGINAIAFHPDGQTLAVAYGDGVILLWDVERGEPVGAGLKATYGADSLAFSPDGRHLLSSTSDGVVLWDTMRGQPASNRVPQFPGKVRELTFGPDGTTAAAVTTDRGVVIWDIKSGQLVPAPSSIGGERVTAFAFHPDGKTWLFGTSKAVVFYDVKTRRVRHELTHDLTLKQSLSTLRVSADGNTMVIKGALSAPKVVDPVRHQDLGVLYDLSVGEARGVVTPIMTLSDVSFALAPDGLLFAQSFPDGAIILWNFRQDRSLGEAIGSEQSSVVDNFLKSLPGIFGKTETSNVVLRDTARRPPSEETIRTGHSDITAFAFSPDSRILATGGREGSIIFWDVESRQPIGEPLPPVGHAVNHLAFSPDGKLLASHVGSEGGSLRTSVGDDGRLWSDRFSRVTLWDVARRKPIDRPFDEQAGSKTLGFSPDGRLLMSAGDGKILLYDVERQKIEAELTHEGGRMDTHAGAVFSVDGRQVLSLTKTSLVTWDVASRRRMDEPVRMPAAASHMLVRLSPDGKLLVLVSADGLRLFDAATRQPLGELFGGKDFSPVPDYGYGHVGFSADGRQFVVGGMFSPDGKWLASSASGSPFVWDIDIDRWLAQACQLVSRDLTAAEWRRYAGTDVGYVSACPALPRASAP